MPGMAQGLGGVGMDIDPISLTLSPASPAPHQPFTLSLESSTLNLANSTFSVSVNGKKVADGTGRTPVSLTAGAGGAPMSISVSVSSAGQTYQKTVVLRPAGLVLVTEPLSSAPILYPGKSGIPVMGGARIVAVPDFRTKDGTPIDPHTLSYTWRVDDSQTLVKDSGIGKNAVIVATPLPYRTKTVAVTVQDQAGSLVASQSITLAPTDPTVRVYASDPLMGTLYEHALSSSYTMPGSDATFVAVPYGFPTDTNAPQITWYLNEQKSQTGERITLQPQGSGEGSEALAVSISTPATSARASANFQLLFKAEARGSGLFGL